MNDEVARLNIEHYRRLLAQEVDETKRLAIMQLLRQEEAKLPKPPANNKRRPT